MRENTLTRLTVVDRTTAEIATNRHPDDHRTGVSVIGAVAQHRYFVAQLHCRWPDVVEELNLHHGLEASDGHAQGSADDVGLSQR